MSTPTTNAYTKELPVEPVPYNLDLPIWREAFLAPVNVLYLRPWPPKALKIYHGHEVFEGITTF